MGAVSTMLLTKTSLIFFKHIPRLLYMFDFKWGGRLFKDFVGLTIAFDGLMIETVSVYESLECLLLKSSGDEV